MIMGREKKKTDKKEIVSLQSIVKKNLRTNVDDDLKNDTQNYELIHNMDDV